jgi:hypothetical protein
MRRREDLPLQKVTLSLYEGDFNRLRELKPELGAARVIRLLVRQFIQKVEAKTNDASHSSIASP